MIFNCTIRSFLHERQGDGRANSSQQPTRGRSLARRFRASFCATLTRREPRAVRPRAAERKNVSPSQLPAARSNNASYFVPVSARGKK